jgi:hypothetical protein
MPLVTITQDVYKLSDGSLPSSYAVHLQLSVPALVFNGATTLIRRPITLTAEPGSGVISGQVPHLNHPDLSPTPVYYLVTEFADGQRVRAPWQLTPAAEDVTIDLDARAPIAGDPGTPVAVGPPGAPRDDGRDIELRASATHVQWRYVGDPTWTDLVALADLGAQTYDSLDDVDTTGLADGDAMVWNQASGKWVRVSLPSTYVAQADLTAALGPAVDDYLTENPVSAPVTSVNAKTGAVVLGAADVGADPAGTAAGLVGALVIPDSPDDIGAASAAHTHAPEDVTGTAVITTDARLSDARPPLAHLHTLADVTDAGDAAGLDVGTTAGTVMAGDDSRVTSLSSTYVAPTGTDGRLQVNGVDVEPAQVGAEPARGSDDNYVTDAEKLALHSHTNKTALDAVSGTNTGDQDLSGLVPKSLVDAKGDLIVATAAGTVARLAVGATNGHVLTVDSAETSGLKWAAASGGSGGVFYAPLAVSLLGLAEGVNGQSVGLADPSGVFSNGTPANEPLQLAGLPVSIGTPMTVVSAYVTLTSAVAGGTARVGLYGVNSSGQPTGAPLLDSGVILTDTTGTKSFSPASPLVLPAGTYWTLAVVSSTSVQFDGWRYARGGWRSGGYTLSPSGWNTALEVASTADPLPTLTATRLVRHDWSGRVSPLLTLQGPNS